MFSKCLVSSRFRILVQWFIAFHFCFSAAAQCFTCKKIPPGVIFCDDFEDDIPLNQKYFEVNDNNGDFIRMEKVGRDESYGMRVLWQKGEVGAGGLSKSFGKTPSNYIGRNAANPTHSFTEIYWRMDVKSQAGWTGGGPAKLSRAMCLANSNWAQGMMAHIWSGNNNNLGMDPATGIGIDGTLKSTKYNDFNNLRWLGWKQGNIPLYSTANSGKWYCIVAHAKLNTPGLKDGIFEFWINDTLQASSTNLDWHSTWNNNPNNLHINAIFFENYWNNGSPVEQERYFDNLVISTDPISCECQNTTSNKQFSKNTFQIKYIPDHLSIAVDIDLAMLPTMLHIHNMNNQVVQSAQLTEVNTAIQIPSLIPGLYIIKIDNYPPQKLYVIH